MRWAFFFRLATRSRLLPGTAFALVFLLPSCSIANNLLPNAGFEVGMERITQGGGFRLETQDSSQGELHASNSFKEVTFTPVPVGKFPSTVHFSVDMRAEVAATHVRLMIYGPSGKITQGPSLKLTKTWKRYTLTATLASGEINKELGEIFVVVPAIWNQTGTRIHFDSVSISLDGTTAYSPKKELEVGCYSEAYANVFFDEAPAFTLTVANYSKKTSNCALTAVIKNWKGEIIFQQQWPAKVPGEGTYRRMFQPENLGYGAFDIFLTIKDGDDPPIDATTHRFAIVKTPDGSSDRFGVHTKWATSDDPRISDMRWKLVDATGAGWTRIFASWAIVEKKSGEFDWSSYDEDVQQAKEHRKKVLFVFYNMSPEFAKGAGDGVGKFNLAFMMEKRLAFIDKFVARYAETVDAWEIFNEPYVFFDLLRDNKERQQQFAKDHVVFSEAVIGILRNNIENPVIISNIASTVRPGRYVKEFIDLSSVSPIPHLIDNLSFHDYPDNLPSQKEIEPYTNGLDLIFNSFGEPGYKGRTYWQSEWGISSDDTYDDTSFLYGEYKMHKKMYRTEKEAVDWLIRGAIYKACRGVVHDFYFLVGTDQTFHNLFSMFQGQWQAPKAIFPAFANLTRILGNKAVMAHDIGSKSATQIGVFGTTKGAEVAVYWNKEKIKQTTKSILLPDGRFAIVDIMGNQIKEGVGPGKFEIPFSNTPHFLIFPDGKDPQEVLTAITKE